MECRARVLYRRGRGCVTGTPGAVGSTACSPSGFAVPSGPGEPVLVPEGGGPPARSPHASLRLGVVDLEARPGTAAALSHPGMHPGPSAPSTLAARVCREQLALPPPSDTEVVAAPLVFRVPSGPPAPSVLAARVCSEQLALPPRWECTLARRYPPRWWRGCVVSSQARTWRIHGLGAELLCTRRRVRKM